MKISEHVPVVEKLDYVQCTAHAQYELKLENVPLKVGPNTVAGDLDETLNVKKNRESDLKDDCSSRQPPISPKSYLNIIVDLSALSVAGVVPIDERGVYCGVRQHQRHQHTLKSGAA